MALSEFIDKSKKPRKADLETVLGRTFTHWNGLISHCESAYPPLDATWNYGSAKWGWVLRLKQKKRTILYMTPCKGHFVVGLVLGDKAVKAAHETTISASVLAEIDGAKKYAEGRPIRIEVKSKKDIDTVKKIAAVKMAN
jgi:hypothetical protein